MKKFILPVMVVLLVMTGCASKTKSDTKSASSGQEATGAQTFGTSSESAGTGNPLEDPSHPQYKLLQERVIYFEYDKSEIQEQYRTIVEAHATYLSQNSNVTVTLEGHADERGSREYNLALGERRAIAVERQMSVLGVADSQIRTVSYGEERPVADGHDESSWSQNRRVEIIY
jgi:peptidoglycan-associated lipoprotein